MSVLFMDTSALLKRYIPQEIGHKFIYALCEPGANNAIAVSQAILIEAVAAFCRRAKDPNPVSRISLEERDRLVSVFYRDLRDEYQPIIAVTEEIYRYAGKLCRIHQLRAYDAIQLTCALEASEKFIEPGEAPLVFISADNKLLEMARAEGLQVDNPNDHP